MQNLDILLAKFETGSGSCLELIKALNKNGIDYQIKFSVDYSDVATRFDISDFYIDQKDIKQGKIIFNKILSRERKVPPNSKRIMNTSYFVFFLSSLVVIFMYWHAGRDPLNNLDKIEAPKTDLINWTGEYVYSENEPKNIVWKVIIENKNGKYIGQLIQQKGIDTIHIAIEAITVDSSISFFPSHPLPSNHLGLKSIYDELFEIAIEDADTVTWWETIIPKSRENINGEIDFIKKEN